MSTIDDVRSQASPPVPGIAAITQRPRDPDAVVDAVLARLADRRGDAASISVFTPAELHAVRLPGSGGATEGRQTQT